MSKEKRERVKKRVNRVQFKEKGDNPGLIRVKEVNKSKKEQIKEGERINKRERGGK